MRALVYLFMSLIFLISCTKKKYELQDKNLAVQVLEDQTGKNETSYKVRVIIDFKGTAEENKKLTEKMYYHIDSCFYKIINETKQYATEVTPIANGLKNTFEYLVFFNEQSIEEKNNDLIYEDRYTTEKTYQLSLK